MAANTWHKDHKTWNQINGFLFKNIINESMSDCTFLVDVENTIVKIPAHKYILGGKSPEFYSLFYLMKADSDEIPINDVSIENFTKFLEFIYTEKTELSLDNLEEMMLMAVRYSVESLKNFCGNFLIKNVTGENVFPLMEKYSDYDITNFEIECLKKLRKNPLIFEDPSFYEISNATLTTILKSEELQGFKEITIFKGVGQKNVVINKIL